ncbi:unannotated protein [freshwater metagenome]|uniref:Unannotated protein n=1 Tax=freshwater metagenome TaxID=449393 RepID=A0A6J5YPA3_9ZZZZ
MHVADGCTVSITGQATHIIVPVRRIILACDIQVLDDRTICFIFDFVYSIEKSIVVIYLKILDRETLSIKITREVTVTNGLPRCFVDEVYVVRKNVIHHVIVATGIFNVFQIVNG